MNSKGFNLFTALVASVMLMTGVVLVNMLITTEDKIGTEIFSMTNNFSLSDAASIAKADALQSFNYNFRELLEDYLTINDNEMAAGYGFNLIETPKIREGNAWESLVNAFERSILLTGTEDASGEARENFDSVLEYISDRTISQFHDGSYGRYHVSLSDRSTTAKKNLQNAMNQAVRRFRENNGGFLEVIGCEENECNIGTFYFIIPLDLMTSEEYEALPRIVIKDLITGEEIKIALLPRTRLNIYVPLRFFKAIHTAYKKNALAVMELEDTIGNDPPKLGFCDSGCEPRSNPLNSGGNAWLDNSCGSYGTSDVRQTLNPSWMNNISYYSISTDRPGITALRAYVRQNICEIGEQIYAGGDDDPTFVNYSLANEGILADSEILGYEGCPFDKATARIESKQTKDVEGTTTQKLSCSTMTQIETSVIFEERNEKYIVSGEVNRYRIGIKGQLYPAENRNLGKCRNSEGSAPSCKPA